MPANEIFSVGEIVSQLYPDDVTDVDIQIVSLNQDDSITAKVVKLGNFFSIDRMSGENNSTSGFILGETLSLIKINKSDGGFFWSIQSPTNRPWHSLIYANNKKHFTHYR